MRIAPKITLSSISLFTIIVVIVGGSNWLIQRSIRGVYSQQQQTQETLKSSLALETLIHEEIMTLKDFVVLGRKASDMVIYQRDRSNVLLALSELESLDVNPEVITLIRDRHTRLGQLANQVTRRSQSPSEVEQSLRAINSFRQDILLGLDTLLEESQGLEAAAETEGEQLRTLALWFQLVMLLGFIGIMLLEFKITFRPIIRSIETLQAGVTEFDVTKREYRLDIQSKDEIEEVAHAFNTMADRLILAYSTLEDQVAVRTAEIHQKNRFLEQTLGELKETQLQLIQTEKMSSLGQMVAGIAHEINNPVNFIYGNLKHAQSYTKELLELIRLYQHEYPSPKPSIRELEEDIDLEFLQEDMVRLMNSINVGTERIRDIVKSLRTFSRLDEADMKEVDLQDGIESTLLILQSRLKKRPDFPGVKVIKDYGDIGLVICYPGQLNQVFLNLMANALEAMDDGKSQNLMPTDNQPTLWITTQRRRDDRIEIRIRDNGPGMTPEVQKKLFEPFFTTKPVGKGTGLGLAISYQIICDRHEGKLECQSSLGKGTEFRIEIPLRQGGST